MIDRFSFPTPALSVDEMTSLAARAIKRYSRAIVKTNPSSKEELVRHLRRTMNNPPPLPFRMPPTVRVTEFHGHGIQGDWLQVQSATRVILYLHGGGYVAGVTKTYHPLCGRLADALQADVFLPAYRLAPEHPFPAALEDAVATYDMLLERGWHPEHIVIAGDSAGGGLTLATLLKLRDDKKPLPGCALVMSPFADMTVTAKSHVTNDATDAILSAGMLAMAEDLYVRNEADLRHPYASPVFGDFTGLPPLLVSVEEEECLRDDAYAVVERAKAAGVPISLISRRGLLHVWPVFYPLLPEARADVAKFVEFVRKVVPARR